MLIKTRISDGVILEGTWKPTSEIRMHLNVYRADNKVVSTAHAHPLNLSILACAGIELDLPTTPAASCICGRIPILPYYCSGSIELAECVIPYVKKYHVVNLGNHGPISWGYSPKEAWYRLENAESSAQLALELLKLGMMRPLNTSQVRELLRFHKIDMPEEAIVSSYEGNENQEPPIRFSDLYNARKG